MGSAGTGDQAQDAEGAMAGTATVAESRREQAQQAVGFDSGTEQRLAADAEQGAAELGIRATDVAAALPVDRSNELLAKQARALSTVRAREMDDERADRVASTARMYAESNLPPSAYVGTYMQAVEALVDEAFADVAEGSDPAEAKADLLAG